MFLSQLSPDELWLRELKSQPQRVFPETLLNAEPPQQVQDKPDIFQVEIPKRRVSYEEAIEALRKEFSTSLEGIPPSVLEELL